MPCLWNSSLPVEERGPTKVAAAWVEIAAEFNGTVKNILEM